MLIITRHLKLSVCQRDKFQYVEQLDKLEVDGGNEMQDKYVLNCPFCGGTEVIESWQGGYGAVTAVSNKWGGAGLYHSICRNCGSVVRSYVKEPEKLLKKKDRR